MRTIASLSLSLLSLAALSCCAATTMPATKPVADVQRATTQSKVASPPAWRTAPDKGYEEGDFVLNDVPLEVAFTTLVAQTAARPWSSIRQIRVDWDIIALAGVTRKSPVTVKLWSPKVSKALEAILKSATGGTNAELVFVDEGDSSIRITTRDHHLATDGLLREYSVRMFLLELPEDPATVEVETLFGEKQQMSRRKRIDAIAKLIKETVDAGSWAKPEACSITVSGERLAIRQVEENHRQIQNLFEQLSETRTYDVLNTRVGPTTAPATTRFAR